VGFSIVLLVRMLAKFIGGHLVRLGQHHGVVSASAAPLLLKVSSYFAVAWSITDAVPAVFRQRGIIAPVLDGKG
jgi:hypothetical protein